MASTHNILISGFGGQGILFAGKIIAYSGLLEGKEVSWLPSYGPEMRGGTANCSVCVSDEPIGSPLVLNPEYFIAMNLPSYEKFISSVLPGGIAIIDSAMIDAKTSRTDIQPFYIPATRLANENDLHGLANMILMGKLLKESKFAQFDAVQKAIDKSVPPKKRHLVDSNIKAIEIGMSM